MTFVGRRIGVEGLVYPRGEKKREGDRKREKERDGSGVGGGQKDMQTDRSVDYGNMN